VQNKKVLLIGGGGYIGTAITKILLGFGYKVCCLDNFIYDNEFSVKKFQLETNYELVKGDFRNNQLLQLALADVTDVVFLAGLVGEPITNKYPNISRAINEIGISNAIDKLNQKGLEKVIFISTCSNYGLTPLNSSVDEQYPLNPLSMYAKAKVNIENYLLSGDKKDYAPVVLRFATAFGLSERMRFDLTINEFALTLGTGKKLKVFDADSWRPYCHVQDFANLIRIVIDSPNEKVSNQIFNSGSDENNFTKRDIVKIIQRFLPNSEIEFTGESKDYRNYKVSFAKVKSFFNFSPQISLEQGIKEILLNVKNGVFNKNDIDNILYGNYEISINE